MLLQLIFHLVGDFITQSQWMADNKGKRHWPAFVHAVLYSLPFLFLKPSLVGFLFILGSHFLIDRYRLARHVVKWKNIIGDPDFWQSHNLKIREEVYPKYSTNTGYPDAVPAWMSVWLLIAADNALHLICNYVALRYL